jgi:hypothetical protein
MIGLPRPDANGGKGDVCLNARSWLNNHQNERSSFSSGVTLAGLRSLPRHYEKSGLAAGVALAKTQWVSNGFTAATTNVQGFGNDNVDVSGDGWPTATNDNTSADMTVARCQQVWVGVLQSNAPTIAGANSDYTVAVQPDADGDPGADCEFTYELDEQGSTITYDADTGEIDTTIN